MENNPESNPKYPHNSADPAGISHLNIRAEYSGVEEIKEQIKLIQQICGKLYLAVAKLENMQLSVDVKHVH